MTVQVVTPSKERDGSLLRKLLHESADELADMYERGEPLWLHKVVAVASTVQGDVKVDIFVEDWI